MSTDNGKLHAGTPTQTPLITRKHESLIAHDGNEPISAGAFLQHTVQLVQALPQRQYAINICTDRLNFQRAMAAVIAAGQCNLLPPNRQQATLEKLTGLYPDSYIINDSDDARQLTPQDNEAHRVDFRRLTAGLAPAENPDSTHLLIRDSQLAAISFTSGSTGESKPNIKTWSMLRQGNAINIDNMLEQAPPGLNMLATVPPQHMYGLELSVLIPMAADVCIYSGQPLYPYDVQQALERMPAPRALVSTPQHLRALTGSGLVFPLVERIYCATAPLEKALACQVEACFDGTLIEIYGCSEVGSIARRQTARENRWTAFSAMQLSSRHNRTTVTAHHLDAEFELQDSISVASDGSFALQGRLADLINIAGKRGSLSEINQQLLAIPQVVDGIVFDPESSNSNGTQRLAAIVVADGIDKQGLLRQLKRHLDPVFLPRPILFTDKLPRSDTGKLPRQVVLELHRKLRNQ